MYANHVVSADRPSRTAGGLTEEEHLSYPDMVRGDSTGIFQLPLFVYLPRILQFGSIRDQYAELSFIGSIWLLLAGGGFLYLGLHR